MQTLVLVSPQGDLVVIECKLWRNPQARREVVGQIIDYAKELQRFSYEDFEAAIRKATPPHYLSRSDTLYERSGAAAAKVPEKQFGDAVSRNLRRGRFLLLIVGDGIHEGVERIAEFLQQHAGLHFTLALIEVAIFRVSTEGLLILPPTIARTVMVPRGVVSIMDDRVNVRPETVANAKATHPVPPTISEARLFETLEAKSPGSTARLRQLVAALAEEGVTPRFTPTLIVLRGGTEAQPVTLAKIDPNYATVWFDDIVAHAERVGDRRAALEYYRAVASLVKDDQLRQKKLAPTGSTGTASLPVADLLENLDSWRAAINNYLLRLGRALTC